MNNLNNLNNINNLNNLNIVNNTNFINNANTVNKLTKSINTNKSNFERLQNEYGITTDTIFIHSEKIECFDTLFSVNGMQWISIQIINNTEDSGKTFHVYGKNNKRQ